MKKASQIIDLQGFESYFRDSAGIRTRDPLIKSQMLYRLSYGIIEVFTFLKAGAKISA